MSAATTAGKKRGRTSVPAATTTSPTTSPVLDALADTDRSMLIPVEQLRPHPSNPRRDLGDLTELTDSIRAHGVRQNLLVVPDPDDPVVYRIVIGHRRTAAAREAGVTHLRAVVDPGLTEADQLELMLLENIQRSDLTPVEEADGYQGLLDLGVDVATIATRTGRSESTVRARLKLRGLPEPARAAVHEHRATLDDAAALAELDDPDMQAAVAEHLGTPNFDYELRRARQAAEKRAAMAPLLARLREENALELGLDDGFPDGVTHALTYDPGYYPNATGTAWVTQDRALEILKDLAAGWCWQVERSGTLRVLRPLTLEEAEERAARASTEPEWLVAQRERDAERERLQAQWAEHATVTALTRRDFIRGLLTRKQVTQAQTRALVAFAGHELLRLAWNGDSALNFYTAEELPQWLGVDVDAVTAQAVDEDADEDTALDAAIREAAANLDPSQKLLAALADAREPIGWGEWSSPGRDLVAWYALLEDLGYTPSDAERTTLEPDDDSGDPS